MASERGSRRRPECCTGRHHRFLHEGGYSIVGRDGSLAFRNPWGNPIPTVPRPPPGDSDLLLERNRVLGIDADTCKGGDGDKMDLGLVVDALLARFRSKDRRTV